jgi:hypothetical protein
MLPVYVAFIWAEPAAWARNRPTVVLSKVATAVLSLVHVAHCVTSK